VTACRLSKWIYRIDDELLFARVRRPVRDMLTRAGIIERIGEDRIHLEVDDAVAAVESRTRPPSAADR